MIYKNLDELIRSSKSSREYFLSLPVEMQLRLHECGDYIKSAQQLHRFSDTLPQNIHNDKLGGWNNSIFS